MARSALPTRRFTIASDETLRPAQGALRRAAVVARGGVVCVELDGETRSATRAVSCLIEPIPGDIVLVLVDEAVQILAILSRPGLGDGVLSLPDRAGALRVRAQSVTVEADTAVRVSAPEFTVRASDLRLFGRTIAWLGRTLSLLGERLTTSVTQSETIAERVVTRAATRLSIVDGLDSEHLGSRMASIKGMAAETTGSKIITGTEDVRVDAKRITLG